MEIESDLEALQRRIKELELKMSTQTDNLNSESTATFHQSEMLVPTKSSLKH